MTFLFCFTFNAILVKFHLIPQFFFLRFILNHLIAFLLVFLLSFMPDNLNEFRIVILLYTQNSFILQCVSLLIAFD